MAGSTKDDGRVKRPPESRVIGRAHVLLLISWPIFASVILVPAGMLAFDPRNTVDDTWPVAVLAGTYLGGYVLVASMRISVAEDLVTNVSFLMTTRFSVSAIRLVDCSESFRVELSDGRSVQNMAYPTSVAGLITGNRRGKALGDRLRSALLSTPPKPRVTIERNVRWDAIGWASCADVVVIAVLLLGNELAR